MLADCSKTSDESDAHTDNERDRHEIMEDLIDLQEIKHAAQYRKSICNISDNIAVKLMYQEKRNE